MLEILDQYRRADDHGPGAPPVGARILRIAFDYAELEAQGVSETVAIGSMRTRGRYDPELIDVLAELIGVGFTPKVHEVSVSELRIGMTLADEVRNVGGVLLVARGQDVTEQLIERLRNLSPGFVQEPVRVHDAPRQH